MLAGHHIDHITSHAERASWRQKLLNASRFSISERQALYVLLHIVCFLAMCLEFGGGLGIFSIWNPGVMMMRV